MNMQAMLLQIYALEFLAKCTIKKNQDFITHNDLKTVSIIS